MIGPYLEHAAVVVIFFAGQFAGHYSVRALNGVFPAVPANSVLLFFVGSVVGLIFMYAMATVFCGLLFLANKLGLIDLKKYNDKYAGFR